MIKKRYIAMLSALGIIIISILMAPANANNIQNQGTCAFYDSVNNITLFVDCNQVEKKELQDFAYSEGDLVDDPC